MRCHEQRDTYSGTSRHREHPPKALKVHSVWLEYSTIFGLVHQMICPVMKGLDDHDPRARRNRPAFICTDRPLVLVACSNILV